MKLTVLLTRYLRRHGTLVSQPFVCFCLRVARPSSGLARSCSVPCMHVGPVESLHSTPESPLDLGLVREIVDRILAGPRRRLSGALQLLEFG